MTVEMYSLGHSNLTFDEFANLLTKVGVSAVADVRSSPVSKQFPWFSRDDLRSNLRHRGISYSFLGEQLGGRPKNQSLFRNGIANYVAMAETEAFRTGIERLLAGAEKYRIAMVCSERDPLHCHRCLLVGRHLLSLGINTRHIHSQRAVETQVEAEDRLLIEENLYSDDFLYPRDQRINEAYMRRNREVAYSLPSKGETTKTWAKNP